MAVHIITDSASDLSSNAHPRLTVLPLSVAFGDTVYRDGIDLDNNRFYEMLVESDHLPTTGQVNPFAFSQAIGEVRDADPDAGIVIVTLSSKPPAPTRAPASRRSRRTARARASTWWTA